MKVVKKKNAMRLLMGKKKFEIACCEKIFAFLPFSFLDMHVPCRIFSQRWLATKNCLDVSTFDWKTNFPFLMAATNLMEMVKRCNEEIFFLSSRYTSCRIFFQRWLVTKNCIDVSIFDWKTNFSFLMQVVKKRNKEFFSFLPFILINVAKNIFPEMACTTKNCLDVLIFLKNKFLMAAINLMEVVKRRNVRRAEYISRVSRDVLRQIYLKVHITFSVYRVYTEM